MKETVLTLKGMFHFILPKWQTFIFFFSSVSVGKYICLREKILKSLWETRFIAKAETIFFLALVFLQILVYALQIHVLCTSNYFYLEYSPLILFLIISFLFIGPCINHLSLHNKLPPNKYLYSHSEPAVSERENTRTEATVFL